MTEADQPQRRVRPRLAWVVPVLLAVAVALVARWAAVPYVVGVFHDDGVYALLARSIADGQGFHYSHLPGAPAATHYPPLYPLLLAAVWRVSPTFPYNVTALLGVNALLLAACACGWWWYAVSRLGWRWGNGAALAFAACVATPVLSLTSALLSEPLFLALLWPALVLCEHALGGVHAQLGARSARMVDAGRDDNDRAESSRLVSRSRELRAVIIAGLAIGVLLLVRTHAVALLVALASLLAWRSRWRDAGIATLAAALVVAPWQLWTSVAARGLPAPLAGSYGSYVGWFAQGIAQGGASFVVATVRANLMECWLLLQDRFAGGAPLPLIFPAMLIVVIAIVGGAWALRKRAPMLAPFVAAYVAIVLVWPYAPWRFVWGVWPVLALLACAGVQAAWLAWPRWRLGVALAATLPAASYFRTELHAYATRGFRASAYHAGTQIAPVVDWVKSNTRAGDVVLAEGEQVVALYADRRAAPPVSFTATEYLRASNPAQHADALRSMIAAVPAQYLITLNPAIQRAAQLLLDSTRAPSLRAMPNAGAAAAYRIVR